MLSHWALAAGDVSALIITGPGPATTHSSYCPLIGHSVSMLASHWSITAWTAHTLIISVRSQNSLVPAHPGVSDRHKNTDRRNFSLKIHQDYSRE